MLALHKWKVGATLLLGNLLLLACLAVGEPKAWANIDWLDIAAEGGVAALALVWLILILNSRPAGRVTNFFALGLSGIFLASFQDCLDEIVQMPPSTLWDQWAESGLMPIGLVLLTFGIYHWRQEQQCINRQLLKRERLFREHRTQDQLTYLGDAEYLRRQLDMALAHQRERNQPLALLLFDVDNFASLNRRYGIAEGDRLLHEMAELVLLNLRRCDLLCRYAGDRFAIVLPNTGELMARTLAEEISNAVRHFAFKTQQGETVFHSVSVGVGLALDDSPEQLLERSTRALLRAKQESRGAVCLAA